MLLKYCTRQTSRTKVELTRQLPKPRDMIATGPGAIAWSSTSWSSGVSGRRVRFTTCGAVPFRRAATCCPISCSSAGEFIAPTGTVTEGSRGVAAWRAACVTSAGIGHAIKRSRTTPPVSSCSCTRHRPAKRVS
jgi:hypothetical protein